jgi:RND family efflux transporter MFP subunit
MPERGGGRARVSVTMDEKASLLAQLRIDRSADAPTTSQPRRWTLWLGAGLVVIALAGGGWWALARSAGVPVRAVVARELATDAGHPAPAASALDASGYVVARRSATVSAKIIGRIVELNIEEGQKVTAGEVLARIDDSNTRAALAATQAQLTQTEASLAAAQVALDDARPIFKRQEQQRAANVISAQDFDAAKATFNAAESDHAVKQRMMEVARAQLAVAQRNQDDTIVRAPFSGVVTVKAAQPGEIVSPSSAGGGYTRTGIGTIVDMDSLEVEVDVSENFINRVHPGQEATARLNAYPDWEIPATVIAVIPTADRSKATVKVRVGFKQKDPRILPEMGVRVAFLGDASTAGSGTHAVERAVVLPPEAVQADGENGTVFVIDGNSVEKRAVRLGARTGEGQLILSGLSAGTKVAVGDFSRLADNTKVSIRE